MSTRLSLTASALALLLAAPAFASFGGGKSDPPPQPSSSTPDAKSSQGTPRQEAEKWYGDAYDDLAKAKKDAADGKAKNAEKRYKKALERGERAVGIDSTYHEAWNLVGYSARKLGSYDKALAAYGKALAIKPDYAPAREYLGEAYVELGQPDKAREQLAWLEKLNAAEDAATLKAALDKWLAANPQAGRASTETAAAPADTSSANGGR